MEGVDYKQEDIDRIVSFTEAFLPYLKEKDTSPGARTSETITAELVTEVRSLYFERKSKLEKDGKVSQESFMKEHEAEIKKMIDDSIHSKSDEMK